MIRTNRNRLLAVAAAGALVLAACGSDDGGDAAETTDAATETVVEEPESTEAPATDDTEAPATDDTEAPATDDTEAAEPAGDGWVVDTEDCVDPELANEPIEGSLSIGSVMPLSGGAAAAAFAPVADGLKAYIDYANENGLLPGVELSLAIEDDQYNKDLTPGSVEKLLDDGVEIFSGIIGTPNNQAVRDLLNEECVPQLLALTGSPQWGEVEDYPWTTGALIPYGLESRAYSADIQSNFPDGADVAMFYVNNEFGLFYAEAFEEFTDEYGITIVDTQTIEAADSAPPTAQVNSIAGKLPDAIMAVPLGAQCGTFLSEVANAKAANPGWEPRVYVTNTCASALIIALAGPAADGMYTSASAGLIDIGNPEVVAASPGGQAFVDYMTGLGKADVAATAGAGWNVGEVTVAILKQAAESPDGLTRASIINAARNFTYTASLAREGVVYKMNGVDDAYLAESLQITQYDAAAKIFNDVGELITEFESS